MEKPSAFADGVGEAAEAGGGEQAVIEEWVVPSLTSGCRSRTIDSSAFTTDESLPFVCRIVYDALPPFYIK